MAGNYSALVGGGTFAGVDQGIDFTGGPFPIYALGPGKVERVLKSGSGWPGIGALITYVITGGPLKGKRVYVAEDLVPHVNVGDPLVQGQTIGTATGSGQAPGIEVGFADASGRAYGSTTGGPQPMGKMFDQAARTLSGGGGGGGGILGTIEGAGAAVGGALLPGGAGAFIGLGGNPLTAVKDIVTAPLDIAHFLGRITDPAFILRGLQIVAGGGLVAGGLFLLAKQIGLASSVPGPVGTLAGAVE